MITFERMLKPSTHHVATILAFEEDQESLERAIIELRELKGGRLIGINTLLQAALIRTGTNDHVQFTADDGRAYDRLISAARALNTWSKLEAGDTAYTPKFTKS